MHTTNLLSVFEQFLADNGLSAEDVDIAEFLPYLTVKSYQKGEMIVRHGEPCTHFFLMIQGMMRCFYVHKDTEVNLRLLCDQSAVLPFSAYINRSPSQEYIECLEACHGVQIAVADVDVLRQQSPIVQFLLTLCAEQHYLALERRLRMIQHKSAAERYESFQQVMPEKIVTHMPAYHIASYLGIAPQSFSRIKQQR